tara:strand:+ start:132 stop:446 length:315 start_codon:yes stop_codon:yes gene_type:complete
MKIYRLECCVGDLIVKCDKPKGERFLSTIEEIDVSDVSKTLSAIGYAQGSISWDLLCDSFKYDSYEGHYIKHFATRDEAERMENHARNEYISYQIDKMNGQLTV